MKIKSVNQVGAAGQRQEGRARPTWPRKARLGLLAVGMPMVPDGNGWTWISAPHAQLHTIPGSLVLTAASIAIAAGFARPIHRRLLQAVHRRR